MAHGRDPKDAAGADSPHVTRNRRRRSRRPATERQSGSPIPRGAKLDQRVASPREVRTGADEESGAHAPVPVTLSRAANFLLRYLDGNPGQRFGPLVRAIVARSGLSRATVAHHLAELVRLGDVARRADGTYVVARGGTPVGRPVLEVKWQERVYHLYPDGRAVEFLQQEFRVVWGRLEHLEFIFRTAPGSYVWWSSWRSRARSVAIAPRDPPSGLLFEFQEPLTPRDPSWQRFRLTLELPGFSQMSQLGVNRPVSNSPKESPLRESVFTATPSSMLWMQQRFATPSHLHLEVHFPQRYPLPDTKPLVRYETELRHSDSEELDRLTRLSSDPAGQNGFRRAGSAVSLSVPSPVLDRRYEIQWTLPAASPSARWRNGPIR
jgi:hypothetical protein